MNRQEQVKQALLRSLQLRYPGDPFVVDFIREVSAQDLGELTGSMILFLAENPEYDGAIIFLQDGLSERRKAGEDTWKSAWKAVRSVRNFLAATSPPITPYPGESDESFAQRVRWQIGEMTD